jgi:hypothetical protein
MKLRKGEQGRVEVENSKIKVGIYLSDREASSLQERVYRMSVCAESSLQEYLIRTLCKGNLLMFV